MNLNELLELCNLAKSAVRDVAAIALTARTSGGAMSHSFELRGKETKLDLDRTMSRSLMQDLQSTRISVICEEDSSSHSNSEEYVWLIDPLDGSFNFLRGAGPSAVSCALMRHSKPILGIVYDLSVGSLTWGGAEIGAFTDGRKISVSTTTFLSDAVVATGVPARLDVSEPNKIGELNHILQGARKIRMIGSAAVSLVMAARGSVDLYTEQSIMPWDIAAGLAIVEGASGAYIANYMSRSQPLTVAAGCRKLVDSYVHERLQRTQTNSSI